MTSINSAVSAFVREVVLPGIGPADLPAIDRAYCGFDLTAGPSTIHRWGLFAKEPIPVGRFVIEYTGEVIDAAETRRRSFRENLYIFALDEHHSVDGGIGGSGAEFINHSCAPNLVADIIDGRIFLTSLKEIAKGEELTLDYELDNIAPAVCSCGSASCTGVMAL